jgi:hypothetical protein
MTDPLTDDQRQRLAVLYATRDALHVELDAFDLVVCAHWVATGSQLPPLPSVELNGPDEATWSPERPDIVDRIAKEVAE